MENQKVYTIDEALVATGLGKFHLWILFVAGGCLMSVINETLGISFIIPASKNELSFTVRQQGTLNATGFIGVVLGAHVWGFLSDTWGRYKVLRTSLFGAFICSLLSSLSNSIEILTLLRFCVGFLVSGCAATSYTYLGEFNGPETRARALVFAALFISFSLVYLPAICWLIIPINISVPIGFLGIKFTSWRLNIVLCTMLTGICGFSLLGLPESPKLLLSIGKHDEALKVLQRVYRINGNTDEYPVKYIMKEVEGQNVQEGASIREILSMLISQTVPLFTKPYLPRTLAAFFIMFSLFCASSGFYMWVPQLTINMVPYKNESLSVCNVISKIQNADEKSDIDAVSYQILVIMGFAFGFNYLIIGFFIKCCGKRNLLMFWLFLSGACGLLLIWANNFYIILILMVFFLSSGNCCSVLAAIAVDLYPTNIRGMALCLILMMGRVGAAFGSYIIGILLTRLCFLNFVLLGGVQMVSVGLAYYLAMPM